MNLTCAFPKSYQGKRLIDIHADLMDCSNGPIYPSKTHLSTLAITFLCILGVVMFILVVFGSTLCGRCKLRSQYQRRPRQRDYETIQGDNLLS